MKNKKVLLIACLTDVLSVKVPLRSCWQVNLSIEANSVASLNCTIFHFKLTVVKCDLCMMASFVSSLVKKCQEAPYQIFQGGPFG